MAQLKETMIDGKLEVVGNIILSTTGAGKGVLGIHPDTGIKTDMLHMSKYGNTIIGYGGHENQNGNTHIYGNDIEYFVASVDASYRPYYKAGDVINFTGNNAIRTAGYVTNAGKNIVFTIPVAKPVIGSPSATITSGQGFVLRQGGNYTHGSAASTFVKPTSYSVILNDSGFVVTAVFDVTTNVVNNDATGIYWDGTVTLS